MTSGDNTRPKLFSYEGSDLPGEGFKVYKHLRDSEYCSDDRAYLEGIWSKFDVLGLADPDFLKRFPAECPARIWEMRLATILADWGMKLVSSPSRGAGMDFGLAMADGRTVWLEATCPTPGAEGSKDRVWAPHGQGVYGGEINRTAALRYLSAVTGKRDQFARAVAAGLVKPTDGFIIAISGAQIPLADVEMPGGLPLIAQALFGVGEMTVNIEIETGRVGRGRALARPSFMKSSGSDVSARLFASPDAEEISAIIFDPHHVKNRPEARGREAGRDLIVVHNPFARVPLNPGQFRSGREFFIGIKTMDHRAKADAEREPRDTEEASEEAPTPQQWERSPENAG